MNEVATSAANNLQAVDARTANAQIADAQIVDAHAANVQIADTQTVNAQPAPLRATCPICPHACSLAEGQRGICHARVARNGKVIDENYGRITSLALDPIEKKPLARFMPGSSILSIGSYGCNMACGFCQNFSIAQANARDVTWNHLEPAAIADTAAAFTVQGNVGVAYTYNEPLVGFEFVRDCSQAVHDRGLVNVLVSNGQVKADPLAELLPLIDAANIDLKGFTEETYRALGGDLQTTLHTIKEFAKNPTTHLEVTMLIVPGLNDSREHLVEAARWLAGLDPSIPLHITRFFPCYKMANAKPTPIETIYSFVDEARSFLNFVTCGNC